jgi:hypothetical protein
MLDGTISFKTYRLLNVSVAECPPLANENHVEKLERLKLMLEKDNHVAFGTYQAYGKAAYVRVEDGKIGSTEMAFVRSVLKSDESPVLRLGYWFCHLDQDDLGDYGYTTSHVCITVDD